MTPQNINMPHKTKHKVNHQPKNKDKSQTKLKPKENMSKDYERAVKTMAKGAGIGFVGLLLGKLFAYLTRVFIGRVLGPDAYGLISLGLAVINVLLTFSLLGFDVGLTRFIAYYKGKEKLDRVKGSILSSFKISLPLCIFFSFTLFMLSEQLAMFFSKPQLAPIFQIFSISLPFFLSMNLFTSIFLGFKRVREKIYTAEVGKNLSTLIFVVLFVYFNFKVIGNSGIFLWVCFFIFYRSVLFH